MSTKNDFVVNNLKETQKMIRFQDSVSLALMVLDTLLLAFLVYGFAGGTLSQMISDLVDRDERWYAALILATFAVVAIALVAHIALIVRALWPVRDAGAHVAVGDDVDIRLVNLNRRDSYGRMSPSVQAYWAKLDTMDEADIAREYIYELQKYSYIRLVKRNRLVNSFLFQIGVVIGIAFTGFVLAFAGIVV